MTWSRFAGGNDCLAWASVVCRSVSASSVFWELLERRDRRFVGDGERDDIAPFFDVPFLNFALRFEDVLSFAKRSDPRTSALPVCQRGREIRERRRHRVRRRKMIDEFGRNPRPGGSHESTCVFLVVFWGCGLALRLA